MTADAQLFISCTSLQPGNCLSPAVADLKRVSQARPGNLAIRSGGRRGGSGIRVSRWAPAKVFEGRPQFLDEIPTRGVRSA